MYLYKCLLLSLTINFYTLGSYEHVKIDNTVIVVKDMAIDYIDGKCFLNGIEVVCFKCGGTAHFICGNPESIMAYCNPCADELMKTPKLARKS